MLKAHITVRITHTFGMPIENFKRILTKFATAVSVVVFLTPACAHNVARAETTGNFGDSLIKNELYDEPILTIAAMGKTYEFTASETGVYNGKRYLKCASEIVDKIYFDTFKKPVDATLTFLPDKSEKFRITKEQNGVSINRGKLLEDISCALNGGVLRVEAKAEILHPEVYASELKKITEKRAEFTTRFESSSINRKHNIRLAARLINGSVISGGGEFSFNKTVGARTAERGFKTAKIITDGKFVDGVGGGVCQASTTLYNAAILSGMTITEQHSHSLAVSYVEPSFDAMVSSDYCDLKFKNTDNSPVFIAARADDKSITFTFYGVKQTKEYVRISEIVDTIAPETDEIFYDETLPFGQKTVKQNPKNGIISEGYLATIVDGKTVKTEKIRRDKYKPVRRVVAIGTNKDAYSEIDDISGSGGESENAKAECDNDKTAVEEIDNSAFLLYTLRYGKKVHCEFRI